MPLSQLITSNRCCWKFTQVPGCNPKQHHENIQPLVEICTMASRSPTPDVTDTLDPGQKDTTHLPGRRVVSWRGWGRFSAESYERGEGESIWQSDQHRLAFSLGPRAPLTLQFEGGPCRVLQQEPEAIGLYPAGLMARIVGTNAHYAQVCWSPTFYSAVTTHLSNPPEIGPDFYPDPLLRPLVRALIHEIGHGVMDHLLADSLMTSIVVRIAHRFSPPHPVPSPALVKPNLQRVLDYIETHLEQELTLTELASVACLSPYHFSRSFKEAMGMGPQRYTTQRRIDLAKRLLHRRADTLADVALASGFADQSHFTQVFRRETGMTPKNFRAAL